MQVNPYVFFTSAIVILAFVLLGVFFPGRMETIFGHLQRFIVEDLGWFYILSATVFLVFVIWLMLGPYASVRLGKDDEEPEYSNITWFAMLFSAGMGIGLLFFGVAEPVLHFLNPPRGGTGGTIEAARQAITLTFFHWGLHAWAIYTVVGLSLAYFAYRHDLPLTIRSTLYPLLGRRIHGRAGDVVEILAVFGTLFGVATSLGLGVTQINAGLDYLGVLSVSRGAQIVLIIIITLMATASVVSGLDVGIRRLSELNMGLSLLLLLFVLIAGPTIFLISSFVQSVGRYLSSLVALTFRTDAYIGTEWQAAWTMFYWGWWISWSPFVGMFIARISRGRTIRSFTAGVLLVPTLLTFLWMTIFGNTALHMELTGDTTIAAAVSESIPTALFVMLHHLPWQSVITVLAIAVIAMYFVTSSDSASLVVGLLTSGNSLNAPLWQRLFWALSEGAVAAVLLLAGGLSGLQTAAITTALPFCAILLLMCYSLTLGLRGEGTPKKVLESTPPAAEPEVAEAQASAASWRQRLAQIVEHRAGPSDDPPMLAAMCRQASDYLEGVVIPTLREVAGELERQGRQVRLQRDASGISFTVSHEGRQEMRYLLRVRTLRPVSGMFPDLKTDDGSRQLWVEVTIRGGIQYEFPVEQLGREALIENLLDAYARWMNW